MEIPKTLLSASRDIKEYACVLKASIPKENNFATSIFQHNLYKAMLLINGEDREQVSWALKEEEKLGKVIILLVKGSSKELGKFFKKEIFFDQEGELCKYFGVKQVPAKIIQGGFCFVVEELKI
jgi:hypothetical protein